jgi:hypothetical protein
LPDIIANFNSATDADSYSRACCISPVSASLSANISPVHLISRNIITSLVFGSNECCHTAGGDTTRTNIGTGHRLFRILDSGCLSLLHLIAKLLILGAHCFDLPLQLLICGVHCVYLSLQLLIFLIGLLTSGAKEPIKEPTLYRALLAQRSLGVGF